MKKHLYLIILLCCFTSCDVWLTVQSRVIDEGTNEPIKNVKVLTMQNHEVANTDSIGHFRALNNKENYAFRKLKNAYWSLKFEHENYITLEKNIYTQEKDSVIYMKRKQ